MLVGGSGLSLSSCMALTNSAGQPLGQRVRTYGTCNFLRTSSGMSGTKWTARGADDIHCEFGPGEHQLQAKCS